VHTEHFLVRKSADRGVRGAAGALLRGRADALICVSGTVAAACPVLGGHPRRHMIYNGTAPAASENATPSRGRLLYVGRLEPDKRVGLTLEIARRLQSDGYSLDVVGTGTLAESLRGEAADLLAAGRVRFHGWQADVAPFFRNAAVLLHPAREGLGYAAIEAMAHGVPVVAPRSSGTAELIAHTGLGVAVDDEQRIGAWAEAVARASALPRATAALPAAFHVRHMCAATMDVYEALLRSTAHAATGEAHPAATPKALHGHGARTRL
jgi:glycosyltransferase involved in cell wall biosynthesis